MDVVCDNRVRRHCCIVTNSHKSLVAAHATHAHEHNIRLEYHGTE